MNFSIELAEKQQLDAQNQTLQQINAKIEPMNLESVVAGILDFENDDITITSGGYDELHRIITT
jgi:hypothetical protein